MRSRIVKTSDILFTVFIVVAFFLIWYLITPKTQGNVVIFRHNGEIVKSVPLDENGIYEIKGDYINRFEIKESGVRVVYTNCPNHQCEKQGTVSHGGTSIVCAPNHVSVTIEEKEAKVDAISN